MQLEFRSGYDNRAAREVDALAEQVLAKTALLTLEHIRKRFQRALVRASNRAAPASVIEQCIDRLLQHPFFVADDDVRRAQFDQALEAVVAVDHAAIEIVQIRGRKTAPIQRHERAQLGRDHGHNGHDHPLRTVARVEEALNDFQTLDDLFRL